MKFAHLAEKSDNGSVSNRSTKPLAAPPARAATHGRAREAAQLGYPARGTPRDYTGAAFCSST